MRQIGKSYINTHSTNVLGKIIYKFNTYSNNVYENHVPIAISLTYCIPITYWKIKYKHIFHRHPTFQSNYHNYRMSCRMHHEYIMVYQDRSLNNDCQSTCPILTRPWHWSHYQLTLVPLSNDLDLGHIICWPWPWPRYKLTFVPLSADLTLGPFISWPWPSPHYKITLTLAPLAADLAWPWAHQQLTLTLAPLAADLDRDPIISWP